MPTSYIEFITALNDACIEQNGKQLSSLLSFLYHPDVLSSRAEYYTHLHSISPEGILKLKPQGKAKAWGQIIRSYCFLIKALVIDQSFESAIELSIKMVLEVVKVSQHESSWICEPMMTVTSELRQIVYIFLKGKQSNVEFKIDSLPIDEKLVDVLQKPFKLCLTDKSDSDSFSKKIYVYFFANELFKCYFKFQRFEAANSLAKVLKNSPNLPSIYTVPKSHLVNYKYYNGLIACMNNDLSTAKALLTEAFIYCEKTSRNQQQLILILLLPIKFLINKKLPSKELWNKFPDLQVFRKLFQSLNSGDLATFDSELSRLEKLLLTKKIYSIYLRMRPFVELKLFKKVSHITDNHQMRLDRFVIGLQVSTGRKYSLDEIESRLSNLIYQALIKGYLSHGNRILVLSKKDAFPKLVT